MLETRIFASARQSSFGPVPTLPLDEDYLGQACGRFKLLATIEEHGRIGGLGGAVAEWRAPRGDAPVQISFGTADEFMHEVGSQDYARAKFGLTGVSIANKVLAAMSAH